MVWLHPCEIVESESHLRRIGPKKSLLFKTVAPKTVKIEGPSEAKVNDTISLECTTSNSNPEARISWVLDGRHIKENGSRITTSPDGGWVSSSNLTTTVQSLERNLTVSCYAVVHDLGQTMVDTHIISVICKCPIVCSPSLQQQTTATRASKNQDLKMMDLSVCLCGRSSPAAQDLRAARHEIARGNDVSP